MAKTPFQFRRGAPISIDLVVEDAGAIDLLTVTTTMDLKAVRGTGVPAEEQAVAASFTVAWHPAAGAEDGFWRGTIAAAVSETLSERSYAVDAALKVAGVPIDITDYAMVEILGRVTAP